MPAQGYHSQQDPLSPRSTYHHARSGIVVSRLISQWDKSWEYHGGFSTKEGIDICPVVKQPPCERDIVILSGHSKKVAVLIVDIELENDGPQLMVQGFA